MQYGRRSGILFSSFVIYERERFCFFAAQGAAGDRRRSAAFFLRARWGEGREAFHAPGRKLRFLRFRVLTQSYAALPARPRFARTLRGHCAPDGAWAWVTSGALPRENHGDRRDKAAQIFRAREGVKAKAYGGTSSRRRRDIARFFCALWVTLGALPLRPRQEPEVPAPPGFRSKTCSHASSFALCANIARFFVRPRAAWAGETLGAPPLGPRQEPEVPAPPGFYSEPCLR